MATLYREAVQRSRPAITRRSHQKSRAGCLACKARRIKCGEEKPACKNCMTRSKACEYPSPINNRGLPVQDLGVQKPISAVTDTFTLRDLRLFHHFLSFAYPSLPLGNQSTWTHEVPQLVFSHEYLMYALLALGASHLGTLSAGDPATDTQHALVHRGRAISGLQSTFKKAQHSSVEYDAMLATCYALAFESALVPNESLDFAVFVRGCSIVTEKIQYAGRESIFKLPGDLYRCPTRDGAMGDLIALNAGLRPNLKALLDAGVEAITAVQTCMPPHEADRNFYLAIYSTFVALQDSPNAGYKRFLSFYAVWFKLAEDTLYFTGDMISLPAQLLWAFFVGLQLFITLMVDETMAEDYPVARRDETMIGKLTEMIEWLEALYQNTPSPMNEHLEWPRRVAKACECRFKLTSPSPAKVNKKLTTLQHLDVNGHIVLGSILDLSASLTNWTEGLVAFESTLRKVGEREETQSIGHDNSTSVPSLSRRSMSTSSSQSHSGASSDSHEALASNNAISAMELSSGKSTEAVIVEQNKEVSVLSGGDLFQLHSQLDGLVANT